MIHCKKCCWSRSGDAVGDSCKTPGCDGVVERAPEFSELVDVLPEPMTCGRRFDAHLWGAPVPDAREEGLDRWQRFKSNGNRVCSFCGSLHPEDMFALIKQAAEAPEDAADGTIVEIEPSDKTYKIYVRQPGVRHAHEGGIKFYTHHLPSKADGTADVTPEQQDEYRTAVRASDRRFERRLRK